MQLTIEEALQRGVTAHKEGKLQDAERMYRSILNAQAAHPDANHNLGVLAVAVGKTKEALPYFKAAIEANPKVGQFWISYINALIREEQFELAKETLEKGKGLGLKGENIDQLEEQLNTSASPSEAATPTQDQIDRLIALYNSGQLQEALAHGSSLAKQFPNNPVIPNILGAVYLKLDNPREAILHYEHAIKAKPDYPEAYHNLGTALNETENYKRAISVHKKTLILKPDFAEANNNIGVAFAALELSEQAIKNYNKALTIRPNYPSAYNNLAVPLTVFKPAAFSQTVANNYLAALNYGTVLNLAKTCASIINLLKHNDIVKDSIIRAREDTLTQSCVEICTKLLELPLLLKIMTLSHIPDLEIEELLKKLRKVFLLQRDSLAKDNTLLLFQSALALQCFTNEFIYEETEEERTALEVLVAKLQKLSTEGKQLSPYEVACIASYRSLSIYDWLPRTAPHKDLEALFKRQITEVEREAELKKDIQTLHSIQNEVSLEVQNQYEANPYPRWINLRLESTPRSINDIVKKLDLKVFNAANTFSAYPEILIAGCGTGQHALTAASRFKNSTVTAIDLSLASLAYAKRKTEELDIENIEYIQADILDLGMLNKTFDIVESAGVLHHMDDPFAGWTVLTDCLKPNGLMKVGLYSELARQEVVRAREMIAERQVSSSREDMIQFRQEIIKQEIIKDGNPILNNLKHSGDFYTISTLRDLLFHVKEHRFTIPQIKLMLNELGLTFIGFDFFNKDIPDLFKKTYPDQEALYDLDKWHEFEILNPMTFVSMYQFWLQKL